MVTTTSELARILKFDVKGPVSREAYGALVFLLMPVTTSVRWIRSSQANRPVYSTAVKEKLAVASVAIALAMTPRVQASGSAVSSAVQQAGRDYYLQACASCHGTDGRGQGPVTASLAVKPPDLTTMAARRKGKYPYDDLASYIDGRKDITAHGSREMPVWGERFADDYSKEPQKDRIIHGKVLMLLVYLESIQR